jgi:hypothetical protein
MTRKVEIIIQTEQILVVRGIGTGREWCRQCSCETDMVNLQTAAALTRADHATVQARLQSGDWHASATVDGTLRVCLASLPAGIAGVLGLARRLGPDTTVSDPKK